MTAFKELLIGGYVLRFWPSDNGWMCGITPQMMDALQQQRTWVDLTNKEIGEIYRAGWANNMDYAEAIQKALKEKNERTI
jgi:hypothetical protein